MATGKTDRLGLSDDFNQQTLKGASGPSLSHGEEVQVYSSIMDLSYRIADVYWPFIKQKVKFSYVVPLMPFMKSQLRKIHTAESNGRSEEAAQIFLDYLKDSKEEGKYQAFVDALGAREYNYLVDVLTDKKDIEYSQDEHKRIIDIFFQRVVETVDPTLIAQDLVSHQIIFPHEAEQIRNLQRTSSLDAAFILLDVLPRRAENWYETFLKVLMNHNHKKLVELIDEKFFSIHNDSSSGEDDRLEPDFPSGDGDIIEGARKQQFQTYSSPAPNPDSEEVDPLELNLKLVQSGSQAEIQRVQNVDLNMKIEQLNKKIDESAEMMNGKVDQLNQRMDELMSLVKTMNGNLETVLRKLNER